jgi:pimeloyl-ACP methyl ester carboxylesterase
MVFRILVTILVLSRFVVWGLRHDYRFSLHASGESLSPRLRYRHADMVDLVERRGYPIETHYVETKDGYVLGVYRIPGPHGEPRPDGGEEACRRPVILQHGLLDSSATWVVNSRSKSLGFILADHGYDVWMSNSRGNAFSRNHSGFSPESKVFWDFTFDDMAAFDLPAVVEYVRHHACQGRSKVGLIAHSQGSTLSFAALSSADLSKDISIFIALAPAIYLNYISSIPLRFLAKMHADTLVTVLGEKEFLPSQQDMSDLFGEFCSATPDSCVSILTAICGFNRRNVDVSRLPVYLAYAPSGTSVKNIRHWAQHVRRAEETGEFEFKKFDYGEVCETPSGSPLNCNQREYGTPNAPAYPLSSIPKSLPIAVFYGVEDKLADPVDVEKLLESLPEGSVVFRKYVLGYEHIDFTWAHNADEFVYNDILHNLKEHGSM